MQEEIGESNPCEANAARIIPIVLTHYVVAILPFSKDRAATEQLREDVSIRVLHETH